MSLYPPAPWHLGGWGIATIGLVDTAAAAEFVPADARLVPVLPGKTIGGLFFLSYESGSLTYNEVNIVAGLVRVGTRLAFLLPRLYVDSTASLAGGREIWAVPKELATFEIARTATQTTIAVTQGARRICRVQCATLAPGLRSPFPLPLPSLGIRDDALLFFTGQLRATIAPARAIVELPADSGFAALGLDRPRLALRCDDLTLAVPAPRLVPRAFRAFALQRQ